MVKILLFSLSLVLSFQNSAWAISGAASRATGGVKRALVYNGPGACDGCYQAAYLMAIRAGLDPMYVDQNALNAFSSDADQAALFKDVVVWLQPGGKSSTVMAYINPVLKDAVMNFVKKGGGYVGFCAGAFASTSEVGTTKYTGYGFMPGHTVLYKNKNGADIIPVTWNGVVHYVYWEGGPYLTAIPEGAAETIATYPTGQIAAARSHVGAGKVFVSGFHPEAGQDWRDSYGLEDPDGLDYALADEMIAWVTSP